ncbi:hypothetical protein CLV56_1874 [Mumia flava]|uniref:Uncharacterized protein n=1 Tax=Mumia flava TaxID=1348852 RepID=A0A0B2B763_9ACTN|nr:hypothetical protein [Mumia flava]PJJ57638.1 hypothetical protein CLV56_1874 [Mumia flava]
MTDAETDTTVTVSRLARIVGQVVAPVTLLTALLFFFGWSRAAALFGYFGLDTTVLHLSTTDYLLGAQDGLFVPVAVVALLTVGASWVVAVAPDALRRVLTARATPAVALVLGALLTLEGILGLFGRAPVDGLVVAPLSLVAGVLLLAAVLRARAARVTPAQRRARAFETVAVFVVVALALFWAVADYSAAVGRQRAADLVDGLPTGPTVLVHSTRDLGIPAGEGVRLCEADTAEVPSEDEGYRLTYAGLALLIVAGDQYVLLPTSWTRERGSTYLVGVSDEVRLDVRPAGADASAPAGC